MPLLADRVQETSTTTGTGTLTLGGATTGYRTFNSAFSNGNVVYYTIDNNAGEWEVGYGTVGTGTLSRDTVLESSNANTLVSFSAGTKSVFCTAPATGLPADQTGNSGKYLTTNGTTTSWGTVAGLTNWTEALTTAAPNATIPVTSFTSLNASYTDIDAVIRPKGTGSVLAAIPDSSATGGNKRGTNSVDLQTSRSANTQVASGTASVIVGGTGNTASGNYSIAGGQGCTASGINSVALGWNSTASGYYSMCFGGSNASASAAYSVSFGSAANASAESAIALGSSAVASGSFSSALGSYASTRSITGKTAISGSNTPFGGATKGTSQIGLHVLAKQTTDATTTNLTSDNQTISTTNQVVLANNSAYYFKGSVIANVTNGGNTKAWTFEGAIKRGLLASSTALVGTVAINVIAADSGASAWTISVTADTSYGCLKVAVTGQAATTIRWVAQVQTTEVTF